MDGLYDKLNQELTRLIAHYKSAAVDGISLSEGIELLTAFVGSILQLVHSFDGLNREEKRDAVISAAVRFYDEVLAPLDIPGVPNLIEHTVVDPALGRLVPAVVAGLLDGLERILARVHLVPGASAVPGGPAAPTGFEPY